MLGLSFNNVQRRVPAYVIVFVFILGCGQSKDEEPAQTASSNEPSPQWVADEDANIFQSSEEEMSLLPLQSESQSEAPPETIFRPDDTRAIPNEADLLQFGIRKYESKRLILYSDVDPEIAATLPAVVDQAYDALVAYFGELPPARSGADFQMTGYLIGDRDLILSAGLLPADLNRFDHGQHRGQEFWMYEQQYDYYRRHLLIHEVTHCYTMFMPGIRPPLWYLEGIAELFGTHRINSDRTIDFRVMPETPGDYQGFGRIEILQQEVAAGRMLHIDAASRLGVNEFAGSRSVPYAWSWALCHFLDSHPRYQERFRILSNHLVGKEFQQLADALFAEDKLILSAEWDQFIRRCEYGWDFPSNAFVLPEKPPVEIVSVKEVTVAANQGWQMPGVRVIADKEYSITATGQVTLANDPKPWISEPQGISIEYANGRPIGRLEVGVLTEPSGKDGTITEVFEVRDCGRGTTLRFRNSGLLMFQVNDFGSQRRDNTGHFQVVIEAR